MSKITFRADDDLVERLESFDTSKSEVLRQALRAYLDGIDPNEVAGRTAPTKPAENDEAIDAYIEQRIDAMLAEKLPTSTQPTQDVQLTIQVDDGKTDTTTVTPGAGKERKTGSVTPDRRSNGKSCKQCGETVAPTDVYCPNCGEKSAHRVFCDCGDELRSDWAFCPGCGRRTPAADVLGDS